MASYTEHLNLLKKDPVADGADTFNIETMLNGNWDKIDAAKGKTDAALSNKVNVPTALPSDTDLNTVTTPGLYYCDGAVGANKADSANAFSLFVESTGAWGNQGRKQTYTAYDTGETYIRVITGNVGDAWTDWEKIATATPPQEYDMPLTGATGTCKYNLDQFGGVRIAGLITRTLDTVYFGTLPEGYRPVDQVVFASCGFDDGSTIFPCTVGADPDGRVWVNDFGGSFTIVPVNMYFLAASSLS